MTDLNFQETLNKFNQSQKKQSSFSSFFSAPNLGESSETLMGSFTRASESISSTVFGERNPDAECFGLSTFQRYIAFALMMGSSFLFFTIALFTLPMVLLSPGKFALTYTMASLLFLTSFSVLNGWRAQLKHLFCWERAPFTITFLGSMMLTLWFSVVTPSYIPVIFFTVMEIITLIWYLGSYLPGGTHGLRWMTRSTIGLPV